MGVSGEHLRGGDGADSESEGGVVCVLVNERGPGGGGDSGLEGKRGHSGGGRGVRDSAPTDTDGELEGGCYVRLLLVLAREGVHQNERACDSIDDTSEGVIADASSKVNESGTGATRELELRSGEEDPNLGVRK